MRPARVPRSPHGDRFLPGALAGAGGMDVVYRARDMQSGQTIALELLVRKRWSEDAERVTLLDLGIARPGKPTPCVGRGSELGKLELALPTCIEEGAPQAVVVTAPPGMGKSRLRPELGAPGARRRRPSGSQRLVPLAFQQEVHPRHAKADGHGIPRDGLGRARSHLARERLARRERDTEVDLLPRDRPPPGL